MLKNIFILILSLLSTSFLFGQTNTHSEIGFDIQAASISNRGGALGGAIRYAFVQEEAVVIGPTVRLQYLWSHDLYYGTSGKSFTYGGGAFFHYRFMEWLYLGTEIEILKNPYRYNHPDKKWALTAFVGGGFSHKFGPVVLNLGLLYDVADAIRDPYTSNPSPLSNEYFLRITDPKNPNMGRYIPLIYRVSLFIPLN